MPKPVTRNGVLLEQASQKYPLPSRSLELPDGYQVIKESNLNNSLFINRNLRDMVARLKESEDPLYLFTHHEVFFTEGVIKQTRSSPNWEGGMFSFATCKHQMRTWKDPEAWVGTWLVGVGPRAIGNPILYIAKIIHSFPSNLDYSTWLRAKHPQTAAIKSADNNPRGDWYTPTKTLAHKLSMPGGKYQKWIYGSFVEPKDHTRSVETYKDGTPKWWRDIEYRSHNRYPPVFIGMPAFVYPQRILETAYHPGRAVLKLNTVDFAESLRPFTS